jgi:RND family efflux transporter MFP subunit
MTAAVTVIDPIAAAVDRPAHPLRGRRLPGPVAWTALAALALLGLGACHRQAPPAAPPAVVVALPVHPLTGGSAGETIRYPVEVAARYSNMMSFRIAGKLIERDVRLGDPVKKGQVIARLDPADAQKQALGAQAAFDAAAHRLVFAKQQLDRDQAQAAQNLIAANQLEQSQDAYSAALAGREQTAAQLVVASNAVGYASLTADHDGVITSENADTGQVLAAGQAVYGLAWRGDTDVNLDAAESDLGRLAIGQQASVTFPTLPGQRFEARIREISPAADPQSRTYRVKLTLGRPGSEIRLGMTGDATLAAANGPKEGSTVATPPRPDAQIFNVPATAIFHQGGQTAVWIVRPGDSTLELRPVTVRSYGGNSATIAAGLKDGEVLVLAGVHTVYAGQPVQQVKPLFDGEGNVAGSASSSSSSPSSPAPSSSSASTLPSTPPSTSSAASGAAR